MEQTVLVVTFAKGRSIEQTIQNIVDNFELTNNKIFLLQQMDEENKYVLTYNVKKSDQSSFTDLSNTIFLHRKKDTNTLYTLNALNEIVKIQNRGKIDASFSVDWSEYHNSILLTKRPDEDGEETLRKIPTKLLKIINTNEKDKGYNK